jgi:hypothetical protein
VKWFVLVAVLALGCKDKPGEQRVLPGGGPAGPGEGQSAKEAMELLCNAEAKSGAKEGTKGTDVAIWIEKHVTHPEVLTLLRSLGALEKEEADKQLREKALRYGIATCPLATPPPAPTLSVDVPAFADTDVMAGRAYVQETPLVTVSLQAIMYKGAEVVALDNGVPAPALVVDGGLPALEKLLGSYKTAPEEIYVAIDKAVPFATMHMVWASLAAERFLVVKRGDGLRVIGMSVYSVPEKPSSVLVLSKTEISELREGAKVPSTWKYPDGFGIFVRDTIARYGNPGSGIRQLELRNIELLDTHTVEDFFRFIAPLTPYVRPVIKRSTP